MAERNPYLTGGSRSSRAASNPYLTGGSGSSPKKAKKKGGRSVGGAVGNLAGDAAGAIAGLIPGAVEMADAVKDDIQSLVTPPRRGAATKPFGTEIGERVIKPVVDTYKYTYGPLVKGDFGEFAKRVYEHPLGPMLDILTIASGGAGAAAKAGLIEGTAARSIRLSTGSGGQVLKQVSRSPIRGYGQLSLDALLKKLPSERTPLGEFARAARVQTRQSKRRSIGNEHGLSGMDLALRRTKGSDEQVAAYLVATLPDPVSLDAYLARLPDVPEQYRAEALQTVAIIEKARPLYDKVVNSYLTGSSSRETRRVVGLRDEMAKVSARDAALKGSLLDETVAAERPFLHQRLAEGAEFEPDTPAMAGPPPAQEEALFGTEVGGAAAQGELGVGALVRAGDRGNIGRIVALDPDAGVATVHFVNRGQGTQANATLRVSELRTLTAADAGTGPVQLKGGPSVEDLKARLAEQGLPEPIYTPDVLKLETAPKGAATARGGGGRQNLPASLKQSQGTVFLLGRAIMDPKVLSTGYLRTVRFAHYSDLYTTGIDAGVWFKKGDRLPEGWERYPLPARPLTATLDGQTVIVGRSTEKLAPLDKTVTDFDEWAAQNLGDKFEVGRPPEKLVDAFRKVTSDEDALTGDLVRTEGGQLRRNADEFLAVPSNYLRALRGEFTRSSQFLYIFNKYPMHAWRTLVLRLRPAWLVGNLVGNSLMFTIGEGGRGLRELGQGMLRLTKSPEERAAFQRLMDETFPTQQHGTFIETQLPKYAAGSKAAKADKALNIVTGGLAKIDQAFERSLRRASVRAELRKHPRLKATAKSMKDDTAGFYQYVQKDLADNPHLVTEIENRINDSLGDFTNLTKFEQEFLRSVFPFYAWFRAITAITLKLPVTYPARTVLLEKIGVIGAELQDKSYPTSLQGLIPLDGKNRVLNTMPLNPYGTTIEVGRMLAALAVGEPGKAGEVVAGANPLLLGPPEFLFGDKLRNGAPVRGRGVIGSTAQSIYEGLPQVRLAKSTGPGRPGTLFAHDAKTEILNYILGGLSPKTINPSRARELKSG